MTAPRRYSCGDVSCLPFRSYWAIRDRRRKRSTVVAALILTCMVAICVDVCNAANNDTTGSSTTTINSTSTELDGDSDSGINNSNGNQTCEIDTTKYPIPIFGTVNGYDVGGPHGVCFRSTYNDSRLEERNDPTNLFLMNDILVQDPMSANLTQYQTCLNGTNMAVEPFQNDTSYLGWQAEYVRGQSFSFTFVVETDLAQYYEPFPVEKPESIQAWFRIMKCAVWKIGYCEPFLDADKWSSYYGTYDDVDPSVFDNELDGILESHSTDTEKNLTYTTEWMARKLERIPGSACRYYAAFNLSVNVLDSMIEGQYFFIAHATFQLHFLNDTTSPNDSGNRTTTMRVDMASPIRGQVFEVSDLPTIFYISSQTKVFVAVVIGVCGLATLILLVMIIVYRNHQVMVMAQAGLLGWLCATTLVAIVFSFVVLPVNDVFCQIDTLLLIPGTMVPTILVGRLWRVYSTLVGATRLGQKAPAGIADRREDRVMNFLGLLALSEISFKSGHTTRTSVAFRQAIPRRAVVKLVFILILPQAIVQIYRSTAYDSYVYVRFDAEGTVGRQACYTDGTRWATYAGVGMLASMYLLAFYLAWCTRKLPSFFNEKDQIFRAALVNGIITFFSIALIGIFDVSNTNSNISSIFYMMLVVVVSMTTNTAVVLPKIQRVRSGEKVVLTRALREMNGMPTNSASSHFATFHQLPTIRPSGVEEAVALVEVNPNEPLPDNMEKHLYQVSETVQVLIEQCNQGRPIEQDQWLAFVRASSAMSKDIAHYHFQWAVLESKGDVTDDKIEPSGVDQPNTDSTGNE